MGITQMTEYSDPYKKRPMTMGEIGCFMSHYNIWSEVSRAKGSGRGCSGGDVDGAPYPG
ncbi:Glycosyltransferase 25 family member, partial [Frankliniella fusca]